MRKNNPTKVITHTSVTPTHWTAADIGRIHFERWGGYNRSTSRDDIAGYGGYHIVLHWDGSWELVRPLDQEGIHCKGQNFSSIGVCAIGNGDNHLPSNAQNKTMKEEVWPFIQSHYPFLTAQDWEPHRKYANKTCHGKLLTDDYWQKVLGLDKRDQIKSLQRQLLQLMNRLYVLLARERMLK